MQPIPLQIIPPVLLAVHNDTRSIMGTAAGGWKTLQAPATLETDCLKLGSKHFGLAYLPKAGEMIQIQVLEPWEFQHAIWIPRSYSLLKLCLHGEDLLEITTPDYVEGFQAGQGTEP